MSTALFKFLRFISFWLIFCFAFNANSDVLDGIVVGISDGDTITFLDKTRKVHKVRLMGIDAPEKSQAFGSEAKQTLSNYIYKKEVTVEYKKYDKYKRIVGKVTLEGEDICLQMIRDGMAWHYTEYEKEQSKTDRELYREAETKAREMKVGLWLDLNAKEPSLYRGIRR
jgi:endonuclease YncB( thermonuclease family)